MAYGLLNTCMSDLPGHDKLCFRTSNVIFYRVGSHGFSIYFPTMKSISFHFIEMDSTMPTNEQEVRSHATNLYHPRWSWTFLAQGVH